ncbi:putative salicylate hydroxylase [Triangularia verruculosa]|uniref:Salicylate hydroxylase n=1 Tax=Triangularia verruculosa TaxID=2587418 RepID=A0AAN6XJ54_9PEZI|nr:putative salicylate hydroxylase [Triangularia verruculosa]
MLPQISPIRVAICGGGLAGASLIQALLQYSHLDVHIFESAPAFKEAGMTIGVTRNALTALELLGPAAAKALESAGAVPMRGVRFLLARGENSGTVLGEVDYTTSGEKRLTSIVHRADFLRELLSTVPREKMHTSKKVNEIVTAGDSGEITLHFTDDTTHKTDILIGADGIHSTVRKFILGEEDPASVPRSTGVWTAMTLQPYAQARVSIGAKAVNLEDPYEHSWIGNGSFVMHNLLSNGQLVQLVIAARDEPSKNKPDQWHRLVSADEIKKATRGWPDHLAKAIDALLCSQSGQPAMYLWDHAPARTYVDGSVCIMGDAAHATTPWQGSGAGMSLEDSLILSSLLGEVKTPREARVALKVYDDARRPRTQDIVQSSRETGDILLGGGALEGYLQEPGTFLKRWDVILDLDVGKHREEALRNLHAGLKNAAQA